MADAQDLKIRFGPFQAASRHHLSRLLKRCAIMCYAIIMAVWGVNFACPLSRNGQKSDDAFTRSPPPRGAAFP
jgi:hypothetical protein